MIKGLYETHLYVADLERSMDFYGNILGLEQCYFEAGRRAAFFWIGEPRQSFLGLWEKPQSAIDKRHFAFQCEADFVLYDAIDFLKSHHLPFHNFLNDGIERPMVFPWIPAVSIYFEDPDGHSLEFIGLLKGSPRPDLGVRSYEDWLEVEEG